MINPVTGLADWQERVVEEQQTVSRKIQKAHAFFNTENFHKLDKIDQKLLIEQVGHMVNYNHTLLKRIERFKFEGPR